ncbi:putative cell wall protein [Helianthus debilis subsp. tardiflorus]
MATTLHQILTLILLFHVIITVVVAGRDIPNTNLNKHDVVKHPESLINHDRGYLIPGVGRGIKPKCKDGFNPFTYNPITGGNNGGILGGHGVPRFGGVGGRSFVPGGDDTFVPNPGFEVPNPGRASTAPGPISN